MIAERKSFSGINKGENKMALGLACLLVLFVNYQGKAGYSQDPPFDKYILFNKNGFKFYVNPEIRKDENLYNKISLKISEDTKKVADVLPEKLLNKFQTIRYFIEPDKYGNDEGGAHYLTAFRGWNHPKSKAVLNAFLSENKIHVYKLNAIEIPNANWYEKSDFTPMVMLHESAHAYHDLILGFDDKKIKAAYMNAKEKGIYKDYRAQYQMKDDKEYFAELTVLYFYPGYQRLFNSKKEFLQRDPEGYKMIVKSYKLKDEEN